MTRIKMCDWADFFDGAYIVDGDRIGREVVGLVGRNKHAGENANENLREYKRSQAYNPESKPPFIVWHGSLNEDCVAVWFACLKWNVI